MTTLVIDQPCYWPWLGYFQRAARADVFVFLDSVQFTRREWQNRNRLRGSDGRPFWLTVPVASHSRSAPLRAIRIAGYDWVERHARAIQMSLGSAPYYGSHSDTVIEVVRTRYEYLVDLNIASIQTVADLLTISPNFQRASELGTDGKRTDLLIQICKAVGADHYYSAAGARAYLRHDEHLFSKAGIRLEYQDWEHPRYAQRDKPFVSHLSILDALMNVGTSQVSAMLQSTRDGT